MTTTELQVPIIWDRKIQNVKLKSQNPKINFVLKFKTPVDSKINIFDDTDL